MLLVGEVRGINIGLAGYVDKKSGHSAQTLIATYFIETQGARGFEIFKVTQRAPMGVNDAKDFKTGVETGKRYAFAIEGLERKPGFLAAARMGSALAELIEEEKGGLPVPQAQATALNLVLIQTTPQTT
jgi:hypothetical protein